MTEKTEKEAAPAKAATTVEVTLLAPHIHRGVDYPPGAKLSLRPDQAQRLIAAQRAR